MVRTTEKVCAICGKKFIGGNSAKYCSKECRIEMGYRRIKERRPKVFTCEYCGMMFHGDRRNKYCSVECRRKADGGRNVKRKKKKTEMSIDQVAKLAREAGLTYGVYVAKMGL